MRRGHDEFLLMRRLFRKWEDIGFLFNLWKWR
jgi:hypothetical protein